jgi:ketosteroid isomerase-like protein
LNTIESWLAKAEIAELITRYAAFNDAGDWDAVAALYTESGRMSRPTAPDTFIDGREAILAAFRARPRRVSRHIVANILVNISDARMATATSQILLYTARPQDGEGLPAVSGPPLVGSYSDILTRTDEGWRFVERRGSLDFRP